MSSDLHYKVIVHVPRILLCAVIIDFKVELRLLCRQANLHCISVATMKELVEMDITHLLDPPAWLEDETEYDIECIG